MRTTLSHGDYGRDDIDGGLVVCDSIYGGDDDNYNEVHNDIVNNNDTNKRGVSSPWLGDDDLINSPYLSEGRMQGPSLFYLPL